MCVGTGARSSAPVGSADAGWLRRAAHAMGEAALEALSPTRCVGCERPGELLCAACRDRMVRIDPATACPRCGAPFGSMLCTECDASSPSALGCCLAACVFEGPAAQLVRAYKDGGERRLASVITGYLARAVLAASAAAPREYGSLAQAEAVTFIPVTAEAFSRRGFDHMEQVARACAELLGLPLLDTMVKHGRADQRRLDRAGRLRQAGSAYEVVVPVAGRHLLMLDDVITTGATLQAAARALRAAGARRVDAAALARVWG